MNEEDNKKDVIVLGVDQSLRHGGFAAVKVQEHMPPEFLGSRSYDLHASLRVHEALAAIEKRIHIVLQSYKPNVVFLEGGSYNSRTKGLYQLGMVAGVIMSRCSHCRLYPREVPPTTWKYFILGNHKTKDLPDKTNPHYSRWLGQLCDPTLVNATDLAQLGPDEADAYLIACFGAAWAKEFYELSDIKNQELRKKFIDADKMRNWNKKNKKKKNPLPKVTMAAILENRELMREFIRTFD
jgi:Holliday junction resolvasome RuvABC endonuclease subunit